MMYRVTAILDDKRTFAPLIEARSEQEAVEKARHIAQAARPKRGVGGWITTATKFDLVSVVAR